MMAFSGFWEIFSASRSLASYEHLRWNPQMPDIYLERTPLHDAASQGKLLDLKALVAEGYRVNTRTKDGITPLHEACLNGHYDCAKFLVYKGAGVHATSADGTTPLFNSCRSGSDACVRLILQHSYGSSSVYSVNGLKSPMHEAAKKGHTECLEAMLSHGAETDMEVLVCGTPLYSACTAGAKASVELLLHSGADVCLGYRQDSPLHAAVRGQAVDIIRLLLDFGADASCRNAEGKTPLDLAEPNSAVRTALQERGLCSLSQLCRLCIRRSLGRSCLDKVSSLVLPQSLKDFLFYQ